MITSLCDKLTNLLLSKEVIKEEDSEIYNYGFQVLASNFAGFFIVFGVAIFTDSALVSTVYFLIFVVLRKIVGGYHAKTFIGCNLIFILISMTVITLSNYFREFKIWHLLICFLYSVLVLCFICPVENRNKPVDTKTKRKSRMVGLMFVILAEFSSAFLLLSESKTVLVIARTINISLVAVFTLAIAGYIKGKIGVVL